MKKKKKMIENNFRDRNKILTINFIKKKYYNDSPFYDKYINEILEHLYNKFMPIFREDENLYNKNINNENSDYYKEIEKMCMRYMEGKDIKKDFYERNEIEVDNYISKNPTFSLKKNIDKIKKELYNYFVNYYDGQEKIYNAQMMDKRSDYYEQLKKVCNKYRHLKELKNKDEIIDNEK
jgi:hypothetical protein